MSLFSILGLNALDIEELIKSNIPQATKIIKSKVILSKTNLIKVKKID